MRYKRKTFLVVSLLLSLSYLGGCATSGKETGSPFITRASQVQLGMSQGQVTAIIGNPSQIYSKFNIEGLYETWTYTKEKPYWILMFQNGRLISMSH